jgi:hypothetical protein
MTKTGDAAAAKPTRPRYVGWAVIAMALSAVFALVASIDLYWQQNWLYDGLKKSAKKAKKSTKPHDLMHQVAQTQKGAVIGAAVAVLVLAAVGWAVYRGRYWARWGVIAVWFLSSFTGTVVGIGSVISVGSSVPGAYKVPAFLAGALLIVAVLLVNMRPSTEFFALSKPAVGPNQPARRGLFAPRVPPPSRDRGASKTAVPTRPARTGVGEETAERARSKKRASTASVAKGAELARSRAKAASKSRRTEG